MQKMKCISTAAIVLSVVLFSLFHFQSGREPFHTEEQRMSFVSLQPRESRDFSGFYNNETSLRSRAGAICFQQLRMLKTEQRAAAFVLAVEVFSLCVRKELIWQLRFCARLFSSERFLCELLTRLKKDGKKRGIQLQQM